MTKKTYTICYQITGGIEIEAETEDEAINIFDELGLSVLYENAGDASITEIFEEEEQA